MSQELKSVPEMEGLFEKFTELLVGEVSDEKLEMVKIWSLYSHIMKVMPTLIKHWASEEENNEAKKKIRNIFEEIQRLNEENKQKIRESQTKLINK
jgi:hypothetical protein